jgi:hypothetical protein
MNFDLCPPLKDYINEMMPELSDSRVLQFLAERTYEGVKSLPTEKGLGILYWQLYRTSLPTLEATYQLGEREFTYFYNPLKGNTKSQICGRVDGTVFQRIEIPPSHNGVFTVQPVNYFKQVYTPGQQIMGYDNYGWEAHVQCFNKSCGGRSHLTHEEYSAEQNEAGLVSEKLCLEDQCRTNEALPGEELALLKELLSRVPESFLTRSFKQINHSITNSETIPLVSAAVCIASLAGAVLAYRKGKTRLAVAALAAGFLSAVPAVVSRQPLPLASVVATGFAGGALWAYRKGKIRQD